MADRGWHSPGHPSYKKDRVGQTDPSRGTSLDEIKRRSKQKNADKRFNSPFAFHEPKYNKVSLINRYPRLFGVTFTTVCLLLFYSKPIYDATLREPTQYELDRAMFLKKRMEAAGWWDNPFWKSSSD
eukprot:TRINITY_DN47022_c0_g1_i1.p1 TRINITY_DN47022_c0_g1~~TRINITY_DN47022_c0_g1_i1.p1  ORF type:complete len:137 (-),score=36.78 TRINITY_DN47022_c0_g1_i1:373-753(-)